ncbi:MAG: hypothetical protein QOG85_2654 [Gaiellaceae bacterium]|jgi:hypothetical protein|nr:hypothetical protein [Gaiellaceae bacterium]
MSGVALDVPAVPVKRSFFRILLAVLAGYALAGATLFALGLALLRVGVLPGSIAHAGPFPLDGAWSVGADIAAATLIVLVAAWWIRAAIANATLAPVSYGVVVVAVAATGYAPFLAVRPVPLGIVALPATTWIVRRYAIGTTLPSLRVSWRVWAALAVVAFGVSASYGVYHPLTEDGYWRDLDAPASGTYSMIVTLGNPSLADVRILRVDGGFLHGRWHRHPLPWTFDARSQTELTVFHRGCAPPDVTIAYSVLGVTSSQRFTVGSLSSCQR